VLCETRSNWSEQREDGSDEDGTAATKEFVDRVRDPRSTVAESDHPSGIGRKLISNLQQGNCNIRTGVNKSNSPTVRRAGTRGRTSFSRLWDTKLGRKAQIGTVRASLIPPLDRCGNGVQKDGHVQDPRMLPTVRSFLTESTPIVLIEILKLFKEMRVLSYESTFVKKGSNIFEAVLCSEAIDVCEELFP
jgi:hypothetical protein